MPPSLNHQAQRTLDKLISELQRLPAGIEEEEVEARFASGSDVADHCSKNRPRRALCRWRRTGYYLARVRPFEEIQAAINASERRRHPPPLAAAGNQWISASSPWARRR